MTDTARALSAMAAAVVVRTRSHELLERMASASSVPVVNALSPRHHPCEALVSLFTLRQHFGRLEGIRLAFVGAINNVSRSLVEASVALGLQVRVACPPAYATEASQAQVFDDPREAVEGADAVYTDVWQSMGDEENEQLERVFEGFQVDEELMRHAAGDAMFMHCLPARRGLEVAAEVIDGPRSLVWKQVANHVPVTQAILYTLIADDVSVR